MNKEERPFFSIIVPVYNAEKYIRECVFSVISQTYPNWELILVDDGSTDCSSSLCDYLANLDERIIAVHKSNGGEFSARLMGLKYAKGKYVTGLDPDDLYVEDYLESLYEHLEDEKIDCLMWSFTMFEDKQGKIQLKDSYIDTYSKERFVEFVIKTSNHSFCSKAIRLEMINRTDFSDVPSVRMSEDYVMVIPVICNINKAKVIDYYGYQYRIHADSTSNTITYKQIIDMCKVSEFGLFTLDKNGLLNARLKKYEYMAFMETIFSRIKIAINNNILNDDEIDAILKHPSYDEAKIVEKISLFGVRKYILMKLFRYKKIEMYNKLCTFSLFKNI